jgi:hypothetical protein
MENIFTGWFLINIIAPVALPVAGILVLWLLPLPAGTPSLDVMTTVKDGQLLGCNCHGGLFGLRALGSRH